MNIIIEDRGSKLDESYEVAGTRGVRLSDERMNRLGLTGAVNSGIQNTINKSLIFNYLRTSGPSYRAQIARAVGVSVPAVSRAINSLMQSGYVIGVDHVRASNGKPTAVYDINSRGHFVVGVDLIKENVELAVSDLSGRVVHASKGFAPSSERELTKALVADIRRVLNEAQPYAGLARQVGNLLRAITIGIPAAVDSSKQDIVSAPLYPNLVGWSPSGDLRSEFGVPVYVENVVKLSAIAEKNFGVARSYADIVFVEISNGIGAGIVADNRLLRGASGSAGEIGFARFDQRSKRPTASKGWLEHMASVEGIRDRYLARAQGNGLLPAGVLNGAMRVCDLAARNDSLACDVITETVKLLSLELVHLILILDPEIVVLGGDFCSLPHVAELFLEPIRRNCEAAIPFKAPRIEVSSLGDQAGVAGASIYAVESLLSGEFPYVLEFAPRSVMGKSSSSRESEINYTI